MAFGLVSIFLLELTCIEAGIWFLKLASDEGLKGTLSWRLAQETIVIYAAFVIGEISMSYTRNRLYVGSIGRAVKKLHSEMLGSMLRAPLSYFERTRGGAILHGYSQQLPQLDIQLHLSFELMLYGGGFGLFVLVMCTIFIWWIPAVFLVLLVVLWRVIGVYEAGEPLRRLKDELRTPILVHFTCTLQGLASLRAYKATQVAAAELTEHMDAHTRASVACKEAESWLNTRMMLLAAALYSITTLGLVLHSQYHGPLNQVYSLSPADSSFIVVNLCFTSFCVYTFVNRKMELAGLARVRDSLMNSIKITPSEAPHTVQDIHIAAAGWPYDGNLSFEDIIVRYPTSDTPAVKGLSVTLFSGEKVAVVGRTGAGKSTIVAAITRMLELDGGRIVLNGVDISQLGLARLRNALSVVSQDPVIFAGTIRRNLDPFDERDDDDLWRALESASLKEYVETQGGLQSQVADLGENLSTGQRQLVCVARALLRRRRVLILDEATSSLDARTEKMVMRAVALEASDATIVQVAHRLQAIVGSDRVLVMERGRCVELGEPSHLLAKPGGKLSTMVSSMEPKASTALREAFRAHAASKEAKSDHA